MSRCLHRWRSHRHANLIADTDREHSPTSHNKVYSRRASPPLTCSACSCSCANAPTTLSCSCDALSLGRWITAAVRRMWAVQSCAMTVTTCDDARCGGACWCCHSCRTVDSMRMRRPDWDCRRSWPWSDWLCTRARFRVFCAQLSLERRSSETILNELFSFFFLLRVYDNSCVCWIIRGVVWLYTFAEPQENVIEVLATCFLFRVHTTGPSECVRNERCWLMNFYVWRSLVCSSGCCCSLSADLGCS